MFETTEGGHPAGCEVLCAPQALMPSRFATLSQPVCAVGEKRRPLRREGRERCFFPLKALDSKGFLCEY